MKNAALTSWLTSPEGLATRLKTERARSGLSGQALADLAGSGWSKAKVSKIEAGRQMPTATDVEAWAKATDADVSELLDLLGESTRVHTSWSGRLAGGQRGNQHAYVELIEQTEVMWSIDRELILGDLQSQAYATAIMRQSAELHGAALDIEAAVSARLERQGLLLSPNRSFEFLVGEAALRNQVIDADGMIEQCELVRTLSRLPSVELGILPLHSPLSLFPHLAFAGFDDEVVLIDAPSGEMVYDRAADIDVFRKVFDRCAADAVRGTEAEQLLDSVIAGHQATR